MKCWKCEQEIPVGAKFCPECAEKQVACPSCKTAVRPNTKFCPECAANLIAAESGSPKGMASSVAINDSAIREFNQTNIASQTNVQTQNVIAQQTNITNAFTEKSLEDRGREALTAGLQSLQRRDYVAAGRSFDEARTLDPANDDAVVCYSLAALAGKPLGQIPSATVDEITDLLCQVVTNNGGPGPNLPTLLLAIVRYDYYRQKGVSCRGPDTQAILASVASYRPPSEEKMMLKHLRLSTGAALRFYLA
ncbi:MAG: zinc ribbon domain-containing protein [Planctomycetota bacterium]|nr:zinc ribbon domain-containing protein [Planctomycetota bacterium]